VKYFYYACLFALLVSGCKKHEPPGLYDKGRIEYRITYLENNSGQISTNLLPKKMKLEFSQDYSINVIEGFMGVFKLNNITHFRNKRCSTLLEVLNKNYFYLGKRGEEMCCFEDMSNMIIEPSDETRTIVGLECKKAVVRLGDTGESFDIYYTNDIKLTDPNISNPYKKIDGVLVEFQLSLSGLKMKFTAEKFESQINNSEKELVFPKNSSEVTRDQMTHIINRLVE
jgi:GLPGLI family protein